jgi:hypothetical protein
MKYKITVSEVREYPEMQTVYEGKIGGKRYYSRYQDNINNGKEGVDYVVKEYPTGKMLDRTVEVYSQEVELDEITAVIKAANQL